MALDVELSEIRDFLAQHAPFEDLPAGELEALVPRLSVQYFRRGSALIARGDDNHSLYILRSGAVDVHDANSSFVDRGEPGGCFGAITLTEGNPSTFNVVAIEDSLALVMPGEVFHDLRARFPDVDHFFDVQRARRMHGAVATQQLSNSGSAILKTQVRELIGRPPVMVTSQASIRQAAEQMSEAGVSSLLVMNGDALAGIVTDRDLRNRVLAAGRDPRDPVAEIMTTKPVTGSAESLAFEVLLEMVGRNIHHLPILHDGVPVGIVTTTDLMRLEQANPVYLAGDIAKQHDVAGVAAAVSRLPQVVESLVAQDASADDIGRIVTAIGDSVERRLLQLAEAELGDPPVAYCWVALGSRARLEQALAADQDNAIIISDEVTAEQLAYFTALAEKVVGWLVDCGYPCCPGDIMATNPRWRVPLETWKAEFRQWMTQPVPEAILQASIFFDMRGVHGDLSLFRKLRKLVRHTAPQSNLFLAHLAKQATLNEPPIGFFRGFVLAKEGDHKDTLDIKRGGVGAVVELARVHALSLGSPGVNTQTRIAAAVKAGIISEERGEDLRDAFEFISYVRLRHQASQVRAGCAPDNHVAPDDLSSFDKRHLREAFGIVRSAQGALAHRYPLSYIS